MQRHVFRSLAIVLLAGSFAASAEKSDDKALEKEVRQAITAVQDCFNRGDAKALATCWTADGEFVGPRGEEIAGREKIEAAFAAFMKANANAKLQLGITSIRRLAEDVVLVNLLSEMTPAPEGVESEPVSTVVLVRRDGSWLVADMHESVGAAPGNRVYLKRLQWLVGHWAEAEGESALVSVHCSCDWNASGNYLIRKFSAVRKSGVELNGTEIIAWDPCERRIRSWTFNSDGSFGESVWTRDGDRWIIKHTGALPNGGDMSVTYYVTPVGADTMKIASKDRLIDGNTQPELPEVTMKRQAAAEKAASPSAEPATKVLP